MKIANKMKLLASIVSISLAAFSLAFTSQAYAATSPDLGAAAGYSVIGGSIVTNTGNTTMPGNLGVSPGIGSPHVTGFPPGIVGPPGVIHDADSDAGSAQFADTAAYGALSGGDNVTCTNIPNELGNQNLVPGVYCSNGDFTLTGTLTLSGSGVWIFRTGATLITSGTANVVGGDPCNVWWKVPSSATLGTNTSLIGNILASTSISMATGASLNGRAFAQTGAVTMDTNTISGPTCAAVATPTPTPNGFGLPGDNRSDNQSDHRSDGRSSTPQPSNVLGASTSTLAATGSNEQSVKIILAATAALSVFLLGKTLLRGHKTS